MKHLDKEIPFIFSLPIKGLSFSIEMKSGSVSSKSNYAYLMDWHEYYTPKALNKILSNNIRAKVSLKPFSVEGNSYDYGTIMIPVVNQSKNADELYKLLNEIAQENHVQSSGSGIYA